MKTDLQFFQNTFFLKIHSNWYSFFEEEITKDYFKELDSFLSDESKNKKIYPPKDSIFRVFVDDPSKMKVIIVGQDPYHNEGQAMGLAFSVPDSFKLPPSLRNIFKELEEDLGVQKKSGDLSSWCSQGVFLINRVLTVEAHQAGSHQKKGWELFSQNALSFLIKNFSPQVIVLWGAEAKKLSKNLDLSHLEVLQTAHPSPLSAYRGFFGSRIFSKINQKLTTKIQWDR